jgi:putative membrane protein
MMNWYSDAGWGGWIAMTLMMVAFWALVILAVVAIFRGTGGSQPAPHRDAVDILDERFARGEIDEADYQQRKAALREVAGTKVQRA